MRSSASIRGRARGATKRGGKRAEMKKEEVIEEKVSDAGVKTFMILIF